MKTNKGITLIALVITIIVLVIIAGVAIANILNDNGIISKSNNAKEEHNKAKIKEEIGLEIDKIVIENVSNKKTTELEDFRKLEEMGLDIYSIEEDILLGTYDGYFVTINKDKEVYVGDEQQQQRPKITIENITESSFTIKVTNDDSDVEGYKYYVGGIAKNEELITDMQYEVTGLNENTDYNEIYVERYYKNSENILSSSKTEVHTKAIWNFLLEKAGIDYTLYTDFASALTDENCNKIKNSTDAMNYIGKLFSNSSYFTVIANNSILMPAICENSNARLAMYNNYKVTESIIASSNVALNAMMSSSRYQVISKYFSKYAGEIDFEDMYTNKAFVLGMSQNRNKDAGFKTESGNFLSVSGGIVKVTTNYTYGTTGLVYRINKFASSVKMDPYGRDPSQSSISITINGYMAIFKI